MKITNCALKTLALVAALHLATPSEAAAYIDPGSGSFFVQMLLAGILGAGMAIKTYWSRIKALFTGTKNSTPPAEDESTDS